MTRDEQDAVLRRYAAGQIGTRHAIEALGARDYADLVIALAQSGLDFPRPRETHAHAAQVLRARAVLRPLLRHGD